MVGLLVPTHSLHWLLYGRAPRGDLTGLSGLVLREVLSQDSAHWHRPHSGANLDFLGPFFLPCAVLGALRTLTRSAFTAILRESTSDKSTWQGQKRECLNPGQPNLEPSACTVHTAFAASPARSTQPAASQQPASLQRAREAPEASLPSFQVA